MYFFIHAIHTLKQIIRTSGFQTNSRQAEPSAGQSIDERSPHFPVDIQIVDKKSFFCLLNRSLAAEKIARGCKKNIDSLQERPR
jgi:hypothetical protein